MGPVESAGHSTPPAASGPTAPPPGASEPTATPPGAAGPMAQPAGAAGPAVAPVEAAPPTAPPTAAAGRTAPPVDAAGPEGRGETGGAAVESRAADVATASERPSAPAPGSHPASAAAPAPGSRPASAAAPAPGHPVPAGRTEAVADGGVFKVRLANFEGPFDLLLQLISRHKMDVTEVALSKVTDEFMAHIRAMGPDWDLDETTEFLVVAATLLDLKAARLLPAAEVEDEGDLALLEARDLLFARLLQYRAYKQIADIFSGRLDDEARRYPRTVGLEAHHAELLPDVVISIGAEGFAKLAVKAMQPRPKPQVYVDHIHAPLVSVQEQAQIVVARLRELGEASFRALVADTDDTLTVVARFLALLELYREKAVALEQETALGDLLVRWTGGDGDQAPTVTDEFDRPPEPPKEEKKA
ncbi:segregation/condensation protein A [Streptomyces luteogriseus]|uniref:segregation and condensation protein A n=1 Tax=Streptomyces luteogriseus TaxID=68233 RepID=UPI0033FE13FA